ncbi:uncharacterized protein RCO7_14475 [Rhynchosporium graminicola]|uniref:Uncharacterized protein n=1 Tax=Rhynchosporium graminicola TaxID=2792576 RepID=A0A1E1KMW7_9HELO|nr:uncharacterized protein RCO7_14475 [Rhynchosporium commune]
MTSSPVDDHEIHAAARLPYKGVTLRFRTGIMHAISDAVSGRSRTSVQWQW